MSRPYNLFFDNSTGRIVVQKLDSSTNKLSERINKINDKEIVRKVNNSNNIIDSPQKVNIERNIQNLEDIKNVNINEEKIINYQNVNKSYIEIDKNNIKNISNKEDESTRYLNEKNKNDNVNKLSIDDLINNYNKKNITTLNKNLLYGIKKTILSDFNYSNNSSNSTDFKIGINKNLNRNNGNIFDCFYLFPNISEINTKHETNIINEKKIEVFTNINDPNDIQYFPIDYVPSGHIIQFRNSNIEYNKLKIKNIFWSIFQTIDNTKYQNDELLSIIPDKNDFIYKNIKLQINFELHCQVNYKTMELLKNNILPYRNIKIKNINPSNSCLYKSAVIYVDTLNGSIFDNIEIDLFSDLNIQCGLLCVKVSVPNDCSEILKGIDKLNKTFYGNIPFSQFILNFDYELS
jgi:hypothetical protein